MEKYSSYVKGYKLISTGEGNIPKMIHAYIICLNYNFISYRNHNAYDFIRSKPLQGLPLKLAAFEIFIGEESCLGNGIGTDVLKKFLSNYCDPSYTHVFVDPKSGNMAARGRYEKVGFKVVLEQMKEDEI
jgi:aminoglycoside 6'-N-acetyltransferase